MLDDIRLVRPLAAVRESYLDASRELRDVHGPDTPWPGNRVVPGLEFTDDQLATEVGFEAFVDAVRGEADRSRPLPADWVHATMLWLVDFSQSPPRYLGRLSIRHELTEFLRTVGGHIGYVIRPSAQRRGLGTRMLAMALPTAAAYGIENALVTCDDDNVASAKVILANGGVEDTGYRRKRRFWVPTRPRLAALEPDLRGVLTAQLDAVTQWARTVDRADEARPSVLAGWTVADLLAHLARSGGTLAQLAPSSADPLPISTYVSAYAAAAADIAEGTRALAVETSADRVGAIERAWRAGLAGLDAFGSADPVVQAARGPILLSDFVVTRLVELLVHADDLGRSLDRPAALDPRAEAVVAAALIQVWADRCPGRAIPVLDDDLGWIRAACGRGAPPVEHAGLPLL